MHRHSARTRRRAVGFMALITVMLTAPLVHADGVMFIQSGAFWMGRDDAGADEAPLHRVSVGAFWLKRHKVTNAELAVATGDVNRPNGLAFSPDEKKLYVIEAAANPRVVRVYDVADGGTRLANGKVFLTAEPGGTPDGFRVDVDGNLWMGWGMGSEALDGVNIFNSEAKLIGRIDLPERCANVCFGGLYRNRLFMAASTSVYSLYVNTQGALGG